jgi:hypothetical protein
MRRAFARAGIELKPGLATWEMDEADPHWPEVKRLLHEFDAMSLPCTKYDESELQNAAWLTMRSEWHSGYPMPLEDDGFRAATYDLGAYCRECGLGREQKAPFRIKSEPKWGRRSLLQLLLIEDEIFVRAESFEEVFSPLGIPSWPVIHHSSGRVLSTVVQLRVDTIAASALKLDGYPSEKCATCGRTRFEIINRGGLPEFRTDPGRGPIMKTQEYFGTGGAAWREIVVSQSLFDAIQQSGIRGTRFSPVGVCAVP